MIKSFQEIREPSRGLFYVLVFYGI